MPMFGLTRRELIAVLGGVAAVSSYIRPLAVRAQQAAIPEIGFLSSRSPADISDMVAAFRNGLREVGYVEGRNLTIQFRWADGHYDRLPMLAAELTARQVAVIVAPAVAPARAAKAATATIPIVFQTGIDPVRFGLVKSLNRPDGNLTGVANLTSTLLSKQLEISHEVLPSAPLVGFLVNPTSPDQVTETDIRDLQSAANITRQQILVLHAATESDLHIAFASFVQQRAGALVIQNDSFLNSRLDQIAALAAQHRVPAINSFRQFVEAGGLMSYGSVATDTLRQVGVYTGMILKGAKPWELPVQQSVKVEFLINLRTAKTLGLTIPVPLLVRADEVIE
jgi:putative tryptophan/tyrosine transport system substrate-binding protein